MKIKAIRFFLLLLWLVGHFLSRGGGGTVPFYFTRSREAMEPVTNSLSIIDVSPTGTGDRSYC